MSTKNEAPASKAADAKSAKTVEKINDRIETASNKLENGIDATATRLQDFVGNTANVLGGAGNLGGAVKDSASAYYKGVYGLFGLLGQFGREMVTEATDHVRDTMKARNLRDAGAMQITYLQHRIDSAASHSQEFTLAARDGAKEVIAPFTSLTEREKAA